MEMQTLFTIGYEGASPDDFWATLLSSGIKNIIDIRDVPISRRPGFSKKALGREAELVGVNYVHLAGLGDPKQGREAAKAGNFTQFRKIFSAHMQTSEAISDLAEAVALSMEAPSCLLCYERNPENCHRTIVASHMMDNERFRIYHLGVRVGLASQARIRPVSPSVSNSIGGGI